VDWYLPKIKKLIITILLFSLTGCYSLTYVKYDKEGKGDVRVRRGTSMYYNPYFRNGDMPVKQKKWRIKRSKNKKS